MQQTYPLKQPERLDTEDQQPSLCVCMYVCVCLSVCLSLLDLSAGPGISAGRRIATATYNTHTCIDLLLRDHIANCKQHRDICSECQTKTCSCAMQTHRDNMLLCDANTQRQHALVRCKHICNIVILLCDANTQRHD